MNKGYSVAITGNCSGVEKISVQWRLYVSQCAESFSFLKTSDQLELKRLWDTEAEQLLGYSLTAKREEVPCNSRIHLKDWTDEVKELIISTPTEEPTKETKPKKKDDKEKAPPTKETPSDAGDSNPTKNSQEKSSDTQASEGPKSRQDQGSKQGQRRRRDQNEGNDITVDKDDKDDKDADPETTPTATEDEKDTATPPSEASKTGKGPEKKTASAAENASKSGPQKKGKETKSDTEHVKNQVCATKRDGVFLLMVLAEPSGEGKNKDFGLTLNVEMKGQHGYLSASDWPLYPFYGCMSLLYVFYGIVWLIVSACQWRDLLRIQFWIGGVIALGMLEKAVFFSEYNNVNITGKTNPGLTVFAELVSCVKRTLARILVIIVSMGFGIVKPRLGNTLHRVLGIGALYFILATIEGCFRSLHPKSDPGKQQLIASIPLAVLDASICWWIFMSLVQTTRTLRIRRNLVKLSLYRHFTNTLVFAVLASVAYMIWSIKTHRFAKNGCITDWSELWLDEAFWHFLFSIVLLVIMVLWRPTANNQRYAFTPIVDFGDDDEDDENMTLSDAFDGMKMRNVKNPPEVIINGDTKRKHKPEDDLKWVEENIPSSAADAVLPSVLDSDEELMTTKFEMSKME